jgi:hypothetical protein
MSNVRESNARALQGLSRPIHNPYKLSITIVFKESLLTDWLISSSTDGLETRSYKVQKLTKCYSVTAIDHNEKDGGMYILLECIASIKGKWLSKDDTK